MAFKSFIGQSEIVKRLDRAIKGNTLSHSYVFSGPEGIGKKTLADAFVSELVCTSPGPDGKCSECNACKMYKAKIPSDYIWIQPEGDHVSVDEIRKIQNDIVIRPLYSDRKVYVVPDGENMTVQAQNCLLKVLEEPPDYAIIIVLTASSDSLIPTVLSRVINYELERYSKGDLVKILSLKGIDVNSEYINAIYGYSGGIPGQALELLQSDQFATLRNDMIKLILDINNDNIMIVNAVNYFEEHKEDIHDLLSILQLFYRDAYIAKYTRKGLLINSDKTEAVQEIANKLSLRKALKNVQCITETLLNIRRNANFRLAVETMILTLMEA